MFADVPKKMASLMTLWVSHVRRSDGEKALGAFYLDLQMTRRSHFWTAVLALLLLLPAVRSVAAVDEKLAPTGIKRVPWGASIDDTARILGDLAFNRRFCAEMRVSVETWCTASFDLGSIGSYSDFRFGDGHFVGANMHFSSAAFTYVRALFEEKYGPPSAVRSETVQALAGAGLQDDILTWDFRDVSIELRHYGTKISEGSATFVTRAWSAEQAKRIEAERKRAKDSF